MYPDWVLLAIMFAAFFFWLCILTYLYSKEASLLSKLFPKKESGDIKKRLDEVTQTIESFAKREEFFTKVLKEQAIDGLGHIQRVQILRYNPYNDTGGEQSFSLALLDGKQNGILITSLHSRSGTRIYTKVITQGTSDIELSKEEKEVLKKVNQ